MCNTTVHSDLTLIRNSAPKKRDTNEHLISNIFRPQLYKLYGDSVKKRDIMRFTAFKGEI